MNDMPFISCLYAKGSRIKDQTILWGPQKNIKSINNNYVDFLAQIENGRYYVASIDV